MEQLNGAPEFLIKMWLGKEIYDSEIREVSATKVGSGCQVKLEGQTFGLIGAVASIIHGLSQSSKRPTSELLYLIKMAIEILEENKNGCETTDDEQDDYNEQCINSFDNFLREHFKKGEQ